jgi:hypothetical protein
MAAKKDRPFVKSADTTSQVSSSKAELEKMLRRYGAAGFSIAHDYAEHRVVISLILPDRPGKDSPRVPVKLPVDIRLVYDALYGRPTLSVRIPDDERNAIIREKGFAPWNRSVYNPKGYDAKKLEQAERVAWRNLVLWVDAALSAATVGLQTITEAFFAHAVVGQGGQRMIEVIEDAQQSLGAGVQRLLTAPAETA